MCRRGEHLAVDMELEYLLKIGKGLGLAGAELRKWLDREANAARERRAHARDAEVRRLQLELADLDRKIKLVKNESQISIAELDLEILGTNSHHGENGCRREGIDLQACEGNVTRVAACDEATRKEDEEKEFERPAAPVKHEFDTRRVSRAELSTQADKPRAGTPTANGPSEVSVVQPCAELSELFRTRSQTEQFNVDHEERVIGSSRDGLQELMFPGKNLFPDQGGQSLTGDFERKHATPRKQPANKGEAKRSKPSVVDRCESRPECGYRPNEQLEEVMHRKKQTCRRRFPMDRTNTYPPQKAQAGELPDVSRRLRAH